jgi:putative pyoverdin transport system ATP-binding/permease protein
MRLIKFLAKYSQRVLVLAVLAGIVGGAASTALLFVINAGLTRNQSTSAQLIFIFLGLAGLAMISRACSALLLAHMGQGAMYQLRMQLSHQILGVPLRRLEEVGAARLIGIVTDDIMNIINAVANVPLICVNIAGLLTCLAFMAWLSPLLFLVVMVLIVVGVVTYQLPFLAATKHFGIARSEHNNVLAHLRSLITGVKELKLNREKRQAFFSELLQGSAHRFQKHSMAAMKIYVLGATWGEMLSFITIGLLVFVAPRIMHVTTTTMTAFVLILIYLMEPLEYIMNQAPQVSKASVALKSIEDVGLTLAKSGSEQDFAAQPSTKGSWKSLDLKNVSFSYQRDDDSGRFMLGPIDLHLSPGELVFFTGGNGSGKTTLAKLLIGLYKPEGGDILLDGKPVADKDRDNYRQYFSVVFSDFYLFESLLGIDKSNLDEKATAYLRQLQLTQKVQITDGVFSTVDLSQGQRKRLALLVAYMEDRPIFLFDEWAADQDTLFKEVFYYQLLPELKARGKTVCVISHDDRYYHIADRIIKFENGQILNDQQVNRERAKEMVV